MTGGEIDSTNVNKVERTSPAPEGQAGMNLLELSKKIGGANICKETDDSKLLSMVGPFLSYEFHSSGHCRRAAHPFGETSWHAVDLRRMNRDFALGTGVGPAEALKLTDLFKSEDIHSALIKDSVVQKALASIGVEPSQVKTLDALMREIGRGIVYSDPAEDSAKNKNPLCFSMGKDILSNFAFHHLEGERVAVRIGLSGTGVCRENLTQIGILLPVSEELKKALQDAASSKGGFLMNKPLKAGTSYSWHFSN